MVVLLCLLAVAAAGIHNLWKTSAWALLGGLVFLSYGFNNIPFGLGSWKMPLAEVLLVALLATSVREWWPLLGARELRPITVPLIGLVAVTLPRLLFDISQHGFLAVRDALYVIDVFAFPVGMVLAQRTAAAQQTQHLDRLFRIAVVWFAFYPARSYLENISPVVGIQKPVPLVAFTSASFIGATALLWFLAERRPASVLFAAFAAEAVLVTQARSMYIALPLAVSVLAVLQLRSRQSRRFTTAARPMLRFAAVVSIALASLTVLPPLHGRLGDARPSFLITHAQTLFGAEGPGSGSIEERQVWWPLVLSKVDAVPLGFLVGVGYGPDLIDGYRGADGSLVRKPHNDFLEIYARGGLLAIASWIGLLAGLIRLAVRNAALRGSPWQWAAAAHVIFITFAFTQPLFSFAYGGIVYFLLFGYLAGSDLTSQRPVADGQPSASEANS